MEQNIKPTPRRVAISAAIGLAGFAAVYFPVALLLLPAFLAFILPAWGSICFTVSVGVSAVSVLAAYGFAAEGWYTVLIYLPATLWLGTLLKKRGAYRSAVAGASVFIALGCYLMLCLPSMLAGQDPFYGMREALGTAADAWTELAGQLSEYEAMLPDIKKYSSLIVNYAAEITVLLSVLPGMLFGFSDLLIAKALAKKCGAQLKPMAPLWLWQLSTNFVWGAVILIVGGVAVSYFSLTNAAAINIALECTALLPFALSGFSFMEFNARIVRKRTVGRRVLSYVLIALLLPYSLLALIVVGVLEKLLRVRKRILNSQDGK